MSCRLDLTHQSRRHVANPPFHSFTCTAHTRFNSTDIEEDGSGEIETPFAGAQPRAMPSPPSIAEQQGQFWSLDLVFISAVVGGCVVLIAVALLVGGTIMRRRSMSMETIDKENSILGSDRSKGSSMATPVVKNTSTSPKDLEAGLGQYPLTPAAASLDDSERGSYTVRIGNAVSRAESDVGEVEMVLSGKDGSVSGSKLHAAADMIDESGAMGVLNAIAGALFPLAATPSAGSMSTDRTPRTLNGGRIIHAVKSIPEECAITNSTSAANAAEIDIEAEAANSLPTSRAAGKSSDNTIRKKFARLFRNNKQQVDDVEAADHHSAIGTEDPQDEDDTLSGYHPDEGTCMSTVVSRSSSPAKSQYQLDDDMSTASRSKTSNKYQTTGKGFLRDNFDNASTFSAVTGNSLKSESFADDESDICTPYLTGPGGFPIEHSYSDSTVGTSNGSTVYTPYSKSSQLELHKRPKAKMASKLRAFDEDLKADATTDIVDDLANLDVQECSTLHLHQSFDSTANTIDTAQQSNAKESFSKFMDALAGGPRKDSGADDDASVYSKVASSAASVVSHFEVNKPGEAGIIPNVVPVGSYGVSDSANDDKSKSSRASRASRSSRASRASAAASVANDDKSKSCRASRASRISAAGSVVSHFEVNKPGEAGIIPNVVPVGSYGLSDSANGDKSRSPRSPSMFTRTRTLFKNHPKATPATETEAEHETTTKEDDTRDEYNDQEDDETAYNTNNDDSYDDRSDYLSFAMSGLTGVVSLNSQYGRKDKPVRTKTNGEKFARFIGLDDDASTFSDNTGMSFNTHLTGLTGYTATRVRSGVTEATGYTAATNATGLTSPTRRFSGSTGYTDATNATGLTSCSSKSRPTQHYGGNQRSRRRNPHEVAAEPAQSALRKTYTVSFEEPSLEDSEECDLTLTGRPGRDGSRFTPRFIPQGDAEKASQVFAALQIDNRSTFSRNSWDTMTTANRSVSTLKKQKSHVELVGRNEQGIVHKAMINPPSVCITSDEQSTRSAGSSKQSRSTASRTVNSKGATVNSEDTTALVMNKAPPLSQATSGSTSSSKESSVKPLWPGAQTTQNFFSMASKNVPRPKINCVDSMSNCESEDIREWEDERAHFGMGSDDASLYTDGDTATYDRTFRDGDTATYDRTFRDDDTAYSGYTGFTGNTGNTSNTGNTGYTNGSDSLKDYYYAKQQTSVNTASDTRTSCRARLTKGIIKGIKKK